MKLARKAAIVTGSSRGIGRAIALGLAQQGADLAVNYRTGRKAAQATAGLIRRMGRRAVCLQADVSHPESASRLIRQAESELGRVDILVNNVGEFFFKRLSDMDAHDWRYVMDSNLSSVHYLCHAVLEHMRRRRSGRIVNIGLSPTFMVRGAPNIAAYSIAKTGVQILTRSLAIEEAPYGILVNCVSPGLIDNGYLPAEQQEWMVKRVPMGRLGRPEEVADAVAFLVSDRASYISGANLSVCGAWDWEDRSTSHDAGVKDLFLAEAAGS